MSQSIQTIEDDDGDDWFNKDENDFVVEIPNTPGGDDNTEGPVLDASDTPNQDVREMLENVKFSVDGNDGNYIDELKRNDPATGAKFNVRKCESGKYVQTIPFTKLANIVEHDTLSMFADLYVQKDEFMATLTKRTYGAELSLVLVRIMNKLGTIPLYETVKQFFKVLLGQDHFFEQLLKFFQQPTENGEKKKKGKTRIVRPMVASADMMDAVLTFLTRAKWHVPFTDGTVRFCDALARTLPETDHKQRELLEKLKAIPLDDHPTRKISIYPTVMDLRHGAGPSLDLRRNIVRGKYESVEHYLDVHLNLLREDFLIPLRTGLEKYRLACVTQRSREWTFAGENIRVHHPVQLLLPATVDRRTAKEQLIVVDLDPADRGYANESPRYRKLALPTTKRLLVGSMVLFSSGPEMDDLIVAVISNREPNLLLNGYIHVELIRLYKGGETQDCSGMHIFQRPLVMVESDIFFEPYHQAFKALARLREDNFPLRSYIVDVAQPVRRLPGYLAAGKQHLFVHSGIEFDLSQPDTWPTDALRATIGLNESQFEAYRMALTNRFSLIQGPPGTGKTFIGLKIVETLLANTCEQILLICLTNHALDQFLCGVTRFTHSIVRMGGQSKHPLLDAYNVKQLHEDEQIDRRLRICYYNTKQEYLAQVEQFDGLQSQRDGSDGLSEPMVQCLDNLLDASGRLNELSQLGTLNLIRNYRIVAMTTTFAARNRTLLELLRTPIVVIEEAAEVLEAHIVASLTQHTEQCVLIGDHKQLRPTTSTYVLSSRYRMDLSLFERMINNRFSVATMTVQHRMRPEMANLLRPTIYPVLEDAPNVYQYPAGIVGMKKSLYFLRHTIPEGVEHSATANRFIADDRHADGGGAGDDRSKRNAFECRILIGLCEYLLSLGPYTAQDIVILTAYNGQMLQFTSETKHRSTLQGVRIVVIDNYQGEESKIVLLSLVRSGNATSGGSGGTRGDTIGFLSHDNRICVALSRAREGLYIVGNMELLARCSKTWASVEGELRVQDAIGESFPLQCATHGLVVEIKRPEDFGRISGTCICNLNKR